MFGCAALFTKGNIFALVWKHGRLGVKLPDSAQHDALMAEAGAEPWKPGATAMLHWVLMPPAFHVAPDKLAHWVGRAHALAAAPHERKDVALREESGAAEHLL